MPTGSCRLLAGLVLLSLAAPSQADELTRRQKGDRAIKARAVLSRHCGQCHTGHQTPGESLLPVLDSAKIRAEREPLRFVIPGDPDASLLIQLVEDGSMPPGGRPRPTPDEVNALRDWVKAGAPGYPRAFDDRTTTEQVFADLEKQDPAAAPFQRYVSFAHLARDDAKVPDLVAAEDRLRRAILLASPAPLKTEAVDDAATLFRFDIRDVGWHARDLFKVDADDPAARVAPDLVPYDLLLLEYPFGFVPRPGDALTADFDRFRGRVPQVRPVAFLRGDWLADALARDDAPTPLGNDLLRLKALAEWNAKKADGRPRGPKARPFPKGEPARVPFDGIEDWQVPLAPLGAVYTREVVDAKPPFRLTADLVGPDTEPTTAVARGDLFTIRVKCDQDVYVQVLYVLADGTIRVQRLAGAVNGGVGVKAGKTAVLFPPDAQGFKADSQLTGGNAADEYYIVLASPKKLPLPTIVESQHAQPTIWRFLPTPGTDADPVVRKVLPLTVKKK